MTYWLDYSAARLTGATIKAAGYTGTIRYIGAGSTGKRTDAAEYRSHLEAGLTVLLVCQGNTLDADGGWSRGVANAKAALADIKVRAPGYSGPIFFTNDRTTLPNPAAWRSYLDGAASVLGRDRVGAYGFRNAMDAARGHATYFWQAGRRADVRPFVHLWQDNNTTVTVGGITCDRNLILKTISEADMPLTQDDLDKIYRTVWRGGSGLPLIDDRLSGESNCWPGDMLGSIAERTSRQVRQDAAAREAVEVDVDVLAEKVAAKLASVTIDYAALAKAVNDDAARRLAQ